MTSSTQSYWFAEKQKTRLVNLQAQGQVLIAEYTDNLRQQNPLQPQANPSYKDFYLEGNQNNAIFETEAFWNVNFGHLNCLWIVKAKESKSKKFHLIVV